MIAGLALNFKWTILSHHGDSSGMIVKDNHRYMAPENLFLWEKVGGRVGEEHHKHFYCNLRTCQAAWSGKLESELANDLLGYVQAEFVLWDKLCLVHSIRACSETACSLERINYQYSELYFRGKNSMQRFLCMFMPLFLPVSDMNQIQTVAKSTPVQNNYFTCAFCGILIYSTRKCELPSHSLVWNIIFLASYNLFVFYMQYRIILMLSSINLFESTPSGLGIQETGQRMSWECH